jgi:hypothetical protein
VVLASEVLASVAALASAPVAVEQASAVVLVSVVARA